AEQAFDDTGLVPAGLIRIRDASGEYPGLACHGRLLVNDGTTWRDRGPHACMKAEVLASYYAVDQTDVSGGRKLVAPTFGQLPRPTTGADILALADEDGARQRLQAVTAGMLTYPGGSAR